MNRLLVVLLALGLSAVPTAVLSQPTPDLPSDVSQFLTRCAGVQINSPANETVAILTCMARVRGVIDGHAITMYAYGNHRADLEQSNPSFKKQPRLKQMWCIPQKMPTADVFIGILQWVANNPEHVELINTNIPNPAEATLSIMIGALIQTHKCVEV